MQGGGHSPATHDYGLGADQVLEAQVVLASGKLITASPCSYPDIFFAIRGGGPSSYGVVVSTVIKAHPSTSVSAQILSFAPLTAKDTPAFMDAVATVYAAYPDLSDAGFSGYGSWGLSSPTPLVGNYSTAFIHTIAIFDRSIPQAQAAFAPVLARLAPLNNTSLFLSTKYLTFPSYASYYSTLSNVTPPVGSSGALGSRLLDRTALTSNRAALSNMLAITAGSPSESTLNNIVFVGGGQVARDATTSPSSGVLPAWRSAYVHHIVARGWSPGTSPEGISAVHHDITFTKTAALKTLAPNSGSYMNEGDAFDPDYLVDFYGGNLEKLRQVKERWDPTGLFFCPTCVGSDAWVENESGVLCRRGSSGEGGGWGGGSGGGGGGSGGWGWGGRGRWGWGWGGGWGKKRGDLV